METAASQAKRLVTRVVTRRRSFFVLDQPRRRHHRVDEQHLSADEDRGEQHVQPENPKEMLVMLRLRVRP